MHIQMNPEEARVIGCLMEKAVTTPDQYPLTLNALTNACNQKSSREPVMNLTPGTVQHIARQLQEKFLIKNNENFKSGVDKYEQRLCNTPMTDCRLSPAEYAIVCLLLLRGPQTAGELRARSPRLHNFDDNQAVNAILEALLTREEGPLVARLPKRPGRQDHEYTHLFYGTIESAPLDQVSAQRTAPSNTSEQRINQLETRIKVLENALTRLATLLGEPIDLGLPDLESTLDAHQD